MTAMIQRLTQARHAMLPGICDRLTALRALLSPGASVTITRDGVTACIGAEKFSISTGVEMEADLEAVCRLSERRI